MQAYGNIVEMGEALKTATSKNVKINEQESYYDSKKTLDEKIIQATHEFLPEMGKNVETAEWTYKIIGKAFGIDTDEVSNVCSTDAIAHFADVIEEELKRNGVKTDIIDDTKQNTVKHINDEPEKYTSEHIYLWSKGIIDILSDDRKARIQFRKRTQPENTDKWVGYCMCESGKHAYIINSTDTLLNMLRDNSIQVECGNAIHRFVYATQEAKQKGLL